MNDPVSTAISRRGFLRAGAAGVAGAALLGTAACSSKSKTTSANSAAIDYYYAPCMMGKDPYSLKLMQSTFGVTFKTIYAVTQPDYPTKFTAFLSQGHIPDVMAINGPDMLQKFAPQGAFGEVSNDLVRQYAPKYAAGIDKNVPIAWATTLFNGKNYGFPGIGGAGARLSSFTEWRTDLLEKAGVSGVPETLDEYESAFAALKKIGVYGMTSGAQSFYAAFLTIFGAHGVLPMQWQLAGGKVVNASILPETKQALELLASWYQKGYIDPECMGVNPVQKFLAGKVAMWDYGGAIDIDPADPSSRLYAVRQSNPQGKIAFAKPPEGPGGRASWSFGTAGWPVAFSPDAAKDLGKVKDVLHMWDSIWSDNALATKLSVGEEGTMYKVADPAKGINGDWEWIGKYTDPAARQAEGFNPYGAPFFGAPSWDISMELNLPKSATRTLLETYGKYGRADLFQNAMTVPGSGQYTGDLQQLKVKTFAQIITGAAPVSSFDSFVTQWNSRGGASLEKAANELYAQIPH
jgi:putative aldouronate transport system substrate-binding protein